MATIVAIILFVVILIGIAKDVIPFKQKNKPTNKEATTFNVVTDKSEIRNFFTTCYQDHPEKFTIVIDFKNYFIQYAGNLYKDNVLFCQIVSNDFLQIEDHYDIKMIKKINEFGFEKSENSDVVSNYDKYYDVYRESDLIAVTNELFDILENMYQLKVKDSIYIRKL